MKFANEYIDINDDTKLVSCLEEKDMSIDIPNVSVYDFNSKKVQFTLMTRHLNVLTQFNTYFTTIYENVIQHFISCQSLWFNKKKIDKVKLYESYKSPVLTNITSKEIQFIVFYDNKLEKLKSNLINSKQNKKDLYQTTISFSGYQFGHNGILPIFTLNDLVLMKDIVNQNNKSRFNNFVNEEYNFINAPTEVYENSQSAANENLQREISVHENLQKEVSVKQIEKSLSKRELSEKHSVSMKSRHSIKNEEDLEKEHSQKVDELTNKIINKLSTELKKEVSKLITEEMSANRGGSLSKHSLASESVKKLEESDSSSDVSSDLFSSDSVDNEEDSKLFTQDFSDDLDDLESESQQLQTIKDLLNE
jgi:hypothetical protein